MDPFVYKSLEAAHAGFAKEDTLFVLDVEPEHIIREVWCYFWHSNAANIEAWIQMEALGGNNVRIPAMVYTSASSYYGFATSGDNLGRVVSGRGSIYWNTASSGTAAPMNPFPLPPIKCRQILLRGKWPATAGMEAYMGVLSVPPIT